jgi:hypothetical protein
MTASEPAHKKLEPGTEDSLEYAAEKELERRQQQAEKEPEHETRTTSRRAVLATAAAGMAGLAGCNALGGNDDPDMDLPDKTETTPSDTPTEEPTDTPEDRFEEVDPNLSFGQIYEETLDTEAEHLTESEISDVREGNRKIRELETAVNHAIEKDHIKPLSPDGAIGTQQALKEIAYNQLGYSTDEVIVDQRVTGGGSKYNVIFTNEEDGWRKHLTYITDFLTQKEAQEGDKEEFSKNEGVLFGMWDEEDLYHKSPLEIDAKRAAIAEGKSREILSDQEWLSGAFNMDWSNDTLLVNKRVEEMHRDWWGKIGYSESATQTIDDIADQHEQNNFNQEVELVKNLSVYHEEILPDDNRKPIDEETYISVKTGDELKEEIEREDVRKPYQLTEGETELYAVLVDYEHHKEEAFNREVPNGNRPEGLYPEGGVNLSEDLRNHERGVYKESEDE